MNVEIQYVTIGNLVSQALFRKVRRMNIDEANEYVQEHAGDRIYHKRRNNSASGKSYRIMATVYAGTDKKITDATPIVIELDYDVWNNGSSDKDWNEFSENRS